MQTFFYHCGSHHKFKLTSESRAKINKHFEFSNINCDVHLATISSAPIGYTFQTKMIILDYENEVKLFVI